jgi:NAD+ diphosphatase
LLEDTMTLKPGFTGGLLDRADHLRNDDTALSAMHTDPSARVLRLEGLDPVTGDDGGLGWRALSPGDAAQDLLFLGLESGAPRFAVLQPAGPRGGSMAVLQLLHRLPAEQVALYGAARSLVDWHYRHGFCARCGVATTVFRAGWGRRCGACNAEHFPRVDPVVIMLAEHGDRVLLGRQPQFPPRMYSALAGFIEPGESLEEAVARELHEEAGVRALSVRYVLSQPWPFPSSLMIGCIAPVASDEIRLDTQELQDAIWLEREEVRSVLRGDPGGRVMTPPPLAIAHSLLQAWVEG